VKLLEMALNVRARAGRWAAVERDRLEDMLAEARSRTEPDISGANGGANGAGIGDRTMNEEA
jgi:hypothetical protein